MATQLPVIARPSRYDGVGDALRGIFVRDRQLPEDFEQLLIQIDQKVMGSRH